MSFDLDGNDIYILEKILSEYSPNAFVAEFNPIFFPNESVTIAYDENHVWNNDTFYGFSFLAGVKMGKKFGYTCIFQNDNLNMYFVRDEFLQGINIPELKYDVVYNHATSNKKDWVFYE